jgi:cysteine desulfurase/selenocysteine lyase
MTTAPLDQSRSGTIDWLSIRNDFPILHQEVNGHPLVYFDSAASSQRPRQVIEAIQRYYERDHANVHRGIHELSNRATAAYEGARERVATYFNAPSSSEIVFTRGATESINLIAATWGLENLKKGDRILLSEMEHHSNLVPWQLLAKRTGAELVFWPVIEMGEELEWEQFDSLLTPDVKLLSLVHISNSLGVINPVKEICRRARANGTITVLDGAQSAGHALVDVQDLGCDFYAFSGHKMCGPTGIGGLFGRLELLEEMPPYHGGGEMIDDVDFDHVTFKAPPHRFEAGTPNMAGAVGLHAAIDYLDSIGREQIVAHDAAITAYAYESLEKLGGVRIFGPKGERGAVLSFLLDDVNANDLVEYVDKRGVALRGGHHCTQPLMKKLGVPGTARASFYFYNQREEVDVMIDALQRARRLFGAG